GVVARDLLSLTQQAGNIARKPRPRADHAHTHIVGVQLGEIIVNEAVQERHQALHLFLWTGPVLDGKGINGEIPDAELDRGAHGSPQRLHAAPVAFYARQAASRRPAAVAVHDHRNMTGRAAKRRLPRLARGVLQSGNVSIRHRSWSTTRRFSLPRAHFPPRQTCMISFSLPASKVSISRIVSSVAFCTSCS